MTDLDAEAKKLGGDFQKRQARLVDALNRRAMTASGFQELEKLVGVHAAPTLDVKQLFPGRFNPDGTLKTKGTPRR